MIIHTALYKKGSIDRFPVSVPTQSGTLTYTGNYQTPTWEGYNSDVLSISGDTSAINAGTHTVTFSIIDKKNFTWEDGSTSDKAVFWYISKATPNLTANPSSIELDANNTSKTISVSRLGTGTITATSSNTSVITVSVSGTTITATRKNSNKWSATITINVSESTNYTSQSISVSAKFVVPAQLSWIKGTYQTNASYPTLGAYEKAYGNGIFVAGSFDPVQYYSPNGINWYISSRTTGNYSSSHYYTSYGNGLFVAAGYKKKTTSASDYTFYPSIVYSSDGQTWYESTIDSSIQNDSNVQICSIAYGNNVFVSVCTYYPYVLISSSGSSWTKYNSPVIFGTIVFANGIFLANSASSTNLYYSTDGYTWTSVSAPDYKRLISANNKFFVVGNNNIYSSNNGTNWTTSSLPSSLQDSNTVLVAYGNGKYILAVSASPAYAIYSEDGIKWSMTAGFPLSSKHGDIVYGNGKFVVGGPRDEGFYYTTGDIVE